ncbi:beta-ketoacyl-[acyl-carrier-protein] synthase family protein [bacterium]|nr:beta-ketoacyl-[acyl-carrier-protein] synthase family protein [bacterium]
MNEVLIVAAEAVSALGGTRSETWQKLLAGESAAAPISTFDPTPYYCKIAAEIKGLKNPQRDANRLPQLLQKLFKSLPDSLPESCSLIGSTLKGAIDLQEKVWRDPLRPSTNYSAPETTLPLPCAAANLVAKHFSLSHPGLTINGACASSTIALGRAASRIAAGFDDCTLVWAAEIVSEFVFSGFASLKALTPDVCRPFDQQRNGLILGEAAAALLLMSATRAKKEGLTPLAKIGGWGVANDALHLTAPAQDGRGLLSACRRALTRAALRPEDISAINAHGTATIHNDQMEISAFTELFSQRSPQNKIPIHSVKGALGHTLGAAGALEATIAIDTLHEQRLPPTIGLVNPEIEIHHQVSPNPMPFSGDHLLLTNSGFGGVNAALILSRVMAS